MSVNASQLEPTICPLCQGTGWELIVTAGDSRARRCRCITSTRPERLLAAARIPPRYEACTLANFKTTGAQQGLLPATFAARRFVENYPLDRKGLLLLGAFGQGKTHLAVGIIKELVKTKGIKCAFYDYRELLKQIQNSYSPSVETTELEVLRPVFDAEIVVLDDLGVVKPTAWVWDAVSLILNTRYNDNRTTIITTNFPDGPALQARSKAPVSSREAAEDANRDITLGDRIGERMRSRIHEMCKIISFPSDTPDYRSKISVVRPR